MIYRQLTQQQRYQIQALQGAGWRQSRIASEIGTHPSTISRELKRNRGQRGYHPQQAEKMAQARRQQKRKERLTPADWLTMTALIEQDWSPEQISGSLKAADQLRVSHEWIYQYIYADQTAGGKLHFHLRCQKLRRKRYGKNDHRGQLPNRRSIDDRPAIVAQKTRVGDWEADTIIGKNLSKRSSVWWTASPSTVCWPRSPLTRPLLWQPQFAVCCSAIAPRCIPSPRTTAASLPPMKRSPKSSRLTSISLIP